MSHSKSQAGFTLAEVLAGMLIMGLALNMAATLLHWQMNVSLRGQENIETEQAVKTAMLYIEREIRSAKTITLSAPGVLKIVRGNGQTLLYYVADKDNNGIKDLYQELSGIASPVVSTVVESRFTEISPGSWEVYLRAKQGEVENRCQMVVTRRSN